MQFFFPAPQCSLPEFRRQLRIVATEWVYEILRYYKVITHIENVCNGFIVLFWEVGEEINYLGNHVGNACQFGPISTK